MWANDWVLTPAREVVFDLPLALGRDPKDRSENPIRRMRYSLYVAVSPTLAVVESYLLTCDRNMQLFGCLGEGKLLCGCDTRWEGIQCSVVNASDPSIAIASLRSVSVGNTKWIAGFEGESTLSLMRVVGGLPTEPVRKLPGIDRGLLQFSPLSDDVVMLFSARFVTLVDLCASFNTQSLAVTGKIESIEGNPKGLLWMPDGTVCTLQGSPGRRTLVDPTTCMTYLLPIDSIVIPIGASHILIVDREDLHKLQVYHTGNHINQKLTNPSLCVPCTWACTQIIGSPSGHHLIASTSHRSGALPHVDFVVHDGVNGTRIAVIPVPLTPPCFFSATIRSDY